MANINIKVGYTVDKTGLNEIKKQLDNIRSEVNKADSLGKLTPELKEASAAASQLEKILNSAWNSKLNQLDLSKVNNAIKNTYGTVEKLKVALTNSGEAGVVAYNNFAKSILETNLQLKQTSSTLDKMAVTFKNTVRYGISSSVFNNLTNSIQKAFDYTVKLDTSLNDIRIVTEKSAEEMDKFAIRANRVAKDLGRSTKDFTEASLIYYQQGLSDEEAQARATVTMKAANVTGQTGREVSEQLTAVWNGYKVTADEAELYVDKLAAVAAGTAADLEELSTGMSKVASAANLMGVDIDQLNAQLATIVSVTRQAPESVGVALKTIYSRMSDIQSGLDDEITLGNYTKKMAQYGVNVLDANNNLRDMGDVIEEIGKKWNTMSREQQIALSQTMAGARQYNNLLSLFDNWDMYTDSLKMSEKAAGTLQEQQDIYMESTVAHLQKLRTETERTYDILFDQNAVNGMSDAMTGLLNIFNEWMAGVGGGLSSLTVLASGLANIFNKQIGASISTMIQNHQASKSNLSAEELKQQIINSYAAEGTTVDANSTNVTEQAKIAQRILDIKTALTQEEYNQLTALQKQIGEDAERIKYLEEYKDIGLEILDNENATIEDYKERLSIEKESLKNEEKKLSYLTREKNLYQKGLRDEEDTEDFRQVLSDLGQKDTTSMEQFKIIETARMKIIDGETLSQKEIETIIEAQNQALKEQEGIVNRVNQGLEGRVAAEKKEIEQLKNKNAQDKLRFNETEAQKQRQIAIQKTVQGVTALISLFTTLTGIISTINDESLNGWEKFKRISITLLATLPMLVTSFGSLVTLMPNLAIGMGAVAAGTKATDLSFKSATVSVLTFETALGPLYLVLLAIAAAIAGVVAVCVTLYNIYNADAEAATRARQAAEDAAKAYEELNQKAEELKQTISDYSDGLEQLKKLTSGTKEYEEALDDVNKKARELIETYKLYDDYSYENGILKINEDALERAQIQMNKRTRDALIYKYSTEIAATMAENVSSRTNLQRTINRKINKENGENRRGVNDTSQIQSLSKDTIDKIVNSMNKVREANIEEYRLISEGDEKFRTLINTLGETDPAIKNATKQIIEQRNAFVDLADSTHNAEKSIKYYTQQMLSGIISSKFSDQITAMSFKNGAYDSGRAAQIASVLEKMPGAKKAEEFLNNVANVTGNGIQFDYTWGNKTLTRFVKEIADVYGSTVTGMDKYYIDNDEDLIRTYAREVLGKDSSEISQMSYKSGAWSRSLIDKSGNKVVDNVSDSVMREQIYQKAISDMKAQYTNSLLNEKSLVAPLEKALDSAKEYGKLFGVDFSDALLNTLDSESKKFDFSSLYARIDPEEFEFIQEEINSAKSMAQISQYTEGTNMSLGILGLSEQDIKNLGFESVQTFIDAFEEGWQGWEWDVNSALEAAMSAKGEEFDLLGLSKQKLEEYQEIVQDYAKNLMVVAEDSEQLAESLEIDADAAVDVAYAVVKMNKAIETLADNMEDWEDVIKNSAKESQEYAEAMGGIRDALADVYNTESKYVSNDFVAEHLEEIERIANGDEEAIENLRNALTDDIIMNIMINNDLDASVRDDIMNSIHQLQTEIPDIKIGTSIDIDSLEDSEMDFMESMQHIIDAAGLTAEQANALFNTMGFQAAFATQEVPTEQEVPEYVTETMDDGTRTEELPDGTKQTWIKTRTRTYQDGTYKAVGKMTAIAMETSADGTKVPQIKELTKTSSGSMNNYSSSNKGGKSLGKSNGSKGGGGGSGSAKKPNTMDPLEKEIDRYHDVNIQLKEIQIDLDKLDKQRKKLFGQDLINNLNKRLALLNKQIETTSIKIDIAKGEAKELQDTLFAKGVTFNSDGTIANYAQAYASQLNYVNSLISQYNSMSAEAQESFKDTIEQAKKDFDKFTKDINRYDEVVTDMIPGLEKDIQAAIDEKIDLQIEKFDMEIEIRLNLAEAERDWNDFKKKIIDEVEDDNILGNAMAKLVDFSSYYKEDNTGVVQALRKQVDNTLAELNQMDTNGWSNVYGDNRTAALEDLKKYYEELMTNLEDVLDLQKEIHESYIDMMDEAQDKFDEQIKSYEMISDLIDHDMKVISLVYGEESYNQLARYYDKQQQNFNSQLDFQRQQVDFWRAQLDALDEGSDAWENAKEKWADAVGELNTLIENSIENLQNKYLNTINSIFQNLNNKVTDGLGLDYIDEEWTLINKNAEQYLDTINSLYEVQKLESKYLDALDNTDSISAQRQIKEIMDEELADLRERDKLTQYDIERANKKYEIALKQIALQEAQQNKTKMRLRRDSQGNYRYEYTTDGDQVGQLQSELNDMYNSLYNFDKSKYQDNLNQMYSVWVEFQEKMAEAAQINDPVARSERELLLQNQYEQLINGLTEQNATVRENLHESAFDDLSRLYDVDVSNFQNMSDQEKEVLMGDLIPYWESGVQHMTEVFAGEDGFLGVCRDAFDQLHDATKDYEDGLDELENAGRIDFESIGEGIDQNIERTQQLITDNNELINSYEQELSAINNVIGELDNLVDKYNAAKDAAIAATKAAYEYWSEQQRQTANAAGKENSSSGSGSDNQNSNSSSNSKGGSNGGAGGDGNLVIGDTATFNGQYYYDSYGTSPAGSKYSGVTNGIVVDRIIGNPYGIHIHSADGKYKDLGWIRKSQLSGYDTGGYTGTWGNDGRLALLHQKELVLNKEDTANMLNAVNIIRNITGLLGNSILGKMAAATAGNFGANIGNDVLEQNVHIDAQFPNVKDSREIEDALNNLVNMASMRANKNNR